MTALKIIKWFGTAVITVSMVLTALNLYPWNVVAACIGNVAWLYAAWKDNDKALLVLQVMAAVIYTFGILKFLGFA